MIQTRTWLILILIVVLFTAWVQNACAQSINESELLVKNNPEPTNPLAEDVATDSTTGNSDEELKKGKLTFGGYFDTYYFINLNHPSSRNNLGNSGISRGFDRFAGQFQLGMFLTQIAYQYKNTELIAEIGFGPNMEYASYGSDFRYKWGTVLANNTYTAIMIKQAYINYKLTNKFTLSAGQFGTHIGNEYIDAPRNFHYSINNTFNAGIPFYHIGLKAAYSLNDHFSIMSGLVNGTDNINDNNSSKSFIGQLIVTPHNNLTITFNTIQGNEANARSNGRDTTSYFGVLDLIANYHLTKSFTITTWLMQGTLHGENQGGVYFSKPVHWSGANLYFAYSFNEILSIGSRLEYFDNRSGARALLTHGYGTAVKTCTITTNISLADGHFTLKPEFRIDRFIRNRATSGEDRMQQFLDSEGNYSKQQQSTIGMAAIYKL